MTVPNPTQDIEAPEPRMRSCRRSIFLTLLLLCYISPLCPFLISHQRDIIPLRTNFVSKWTHSRFKSHERANTRIRSLMQGNVLRTEGNPNNLRIISGALKGKKIESPEVFIRPMMAKVRAALFSTLRSFGIIEPGLNVLDIFSGSGSVGFEALSQGASQATFIDASPACIAVVKANAKSYKMTKRISAICTRAEDFLSDPSKFNMNSPFGLVTLTPPYVEVNYTELIGKLERFPLLAQNGIVVIEYPREMKSLPFAIGNKLFGLRNRRYGRTVLALYINQPTGQADLRPMEFET